MKKKKKGFMVYNFKWDHIHKIIMTGKRVTVREKKKKKNYFPRLSPSVSITFIHIHLEIISRVK